MSGVNSVSNVFLPPSPTTSKKGANVDRAEDSRILQAANEFEATFLSLILKEMRQTEEPDGLFAGDSGDVLGGLFDQLMGQHLASAGGVGLAAEMQRSLRAYDTTIRQSSGNGTVIPHHTSDPRAGGSAPGIAAR